MKDNFLEILFHELHGDGAVIKEAVHKKLLRGYRMGDEMSRRKYRFGVKDALEEIIENKRDWKYSAFLGLLRIVEDGDMIEIGRSLRDSLFAGAWTARSEIAVLYTLIKLGESPKPAEWETRYISVCSEFPNVIFNGLVAHGLKCAFGYFPFYVKTKADVQKVLSVFPKYVFRHGSEAVVPFVASVLPKVSSEVAVELKHWLEQYKNLDPSFGLENIIEEKKTKDVSKNHYYSEY